MPSCIPSFYSTSNPLNMRDADSGNTLDAVLLRRLDDQERTIEALARQVEEQRQQLEEQRQTGKTLVVALSNLLAGNHATSVEVLVAAAASAGALEAQDDKKRTMLMRASEEGKTGLVEKLVIAGAKAETTNADGDTSLLLALKNNDEDTADLLVAATASAGALDVQPIRDEYPDRQSGYGDKRSALHLASFQGLAGTVAKLLSLGADAALPDTNGRSPLDLAGEGSRAPPPDEVKAAFMEHAEHSDITDDNKNSLLLVCANSGLASRLREVLQAGANAAHSDSTDRTALILACGRKHEAAVAELIEATKLAGALDVQGGKNKRSALHVASVNGLAGTVAKLLSLGADAALPDEGGASPLDLADNDEVKAAFLEHLEHSDITDDNKNMLLLLCARRGLPSRLREVLQAGANADHTDKDGKTALMLACENDQEAAAAELMEATKLAGALDVLTETTKLADNGRHSRHQASVLHVASEKGLTGTVAKLLSIGADAALPDEYGETALMLACENKHEAAAAELMEATKLAGALDHQGQANLYGYKRSALHWASEKELAGTVAKLLSLGADASLQDTKGKTPLDIANERETQMRSYQSATYMDKVRTTFVEMTVITDDNKNALLLDCASRGLESKLRAVLQAGANAAHTDEAGKTALMLAIENNQEAVAAELIEATKLVGALDHQVGYEAWLGACVV